MNMCKVDFYSPESFALLVCTYMGQRQLGKQKEELNYVGRDIFIKSGDHA
jgi:hypothetical protein